MIGVSKKEARKKKVRFLSMSKKFDRTRAMMLVTSLSKEREPLITLSFWMKTESSSMRNRKKISLEERLLQP